ncbi:MAG TPA: hypothetical protein VFE05_01800 [Longimicrobiaceae bacterium]|jgi:hypothetical protein|nr:hypothetical protein [Longimicrobiaceae bacterium]
MPDLRILMAKRPDGGVVLRCERADGSATWQRQEGAHARFFPLHDLAHYAAETELGFRDGFYGLIARGWDIAETTGKTARGPLPPEAVAVEHLVGTLDGERATGAEWPAGDFNVHAAEFASSRGLPAPRALTDDELARVRARMRELHARWAALPGGATLELPFDLPASPETS